MDSRPWPKNIGCTIGTPAQLPDILKVPKKEAKMDLFFYCVLFVHPRP